LRLPLDPGYRFVTSTAVGGQRPAISPHSRPAAAASRRASRHPARSTAASAADAMAAMEPMCARPSSRAAYG
jgi:hypothetical protein